MPRVGRNGAACACGGGGEHVSVTGACSAAAARLRSSSNCSRRHSRSRLPRRTPDSRLCVRRITGQLLASGSMTTPLSRRAPGVRPHRLAIRALSSPACLCACSAAMCARSSAASSTACAHRRALFSRSSSTFCFESPRCDLRGRALSTPALGACGAVANARTVASRTLAGACAPLPFRPPPAPP